MLVKAHLVGDASKDAQQAIAGRALPLVHLDQNFLYLLVCGDTLRRPTQVYAVALAEVELLTRVGSSTQRELMLLPSYLRYRCSDLPAPHRGDSVSVWLNRD